MAKKKKKNIRENQNGEIIRARLPEEGEVLGQVVANLGGGILQARCTDNKVRQIMIPGKYRKRMWTRVGDIVLVIPQYGLDPDKKAMLEYTYSKNEAKLLYQNGLIPEEYIID